MEEAGKRTTKLTGVFTGTELALMVENPYFDERLPAREDKPELNFTHKRTLIRTDDEWQEVGTRVMGKEFDAFRRPSSGDVHRSRGGTQAPHHVALGTAVIRRAAASPDGTQFLVCTSMSCTCS